MRIGSLSDIHLSTKVIQARYNLKTSIDELRPHLIEHGLDEDYFSYPKHSTDKAIISPFLIPFYHTISNSNLDLLIVVGDTFDLDPSKSFSGRDIHYNDELIDFIKHIIEEVKIPTLFLPGNSDTNDYMDTSQCLNILRGLSENGINALSSNNNLIFTDEGNFAIDSEKVLIIGLNSLSTNHLDIAASSLNLIFLQTLLGKNNKPVIIYCHHPIFPVMPKKVSEALDLKYMEKQEWLDKILDDYNKATGIPVTFISGHCHTYYERHSGSYQGFCSYPAFFKRRNEETNLGLITDANWQGINTTQLTLSNKF